MPSNIHNIWEYKQIIKSINPMDFPPCPQEVATPLILLVIGRFKRTSEVRFLIIEQWVPRGFVT